ncbi:MAG TPA: SAM-dependent chlorinase/fluorinase, partial [Anaerolineales bacterium]|nr:SAM-dependent chlorinase/fluorinase [Anaerolineales bacterium]
MTVITLLTDFGTRDGYPGVMKGVIWKMAPEVQIADISHTIKPQNILLGALALARTAPFFPAGTIHVAVVDPGVGTNRRAIALQLGEHYFIGPDNGLFTLVLEHSESNQDEIRVIQLDQPSYWLPEISHVFHGRDIFAPCAAYLATGVPFSKLGTTIPDPIRLKYPHPEKLPGGGIRGQVIEIDNFGNLATNISDTDLIDIGEATVKIGESQIDGLVTTFGDRPIGTLIALYGTAHDLVISVVNGNAASTLNMTLGEIVE